MSDYDPVKRHEYYERTKQLKGRPTRKVNEKARMKDEATITKMASDLMSLHMAGKQDTDEYKRKEVQYHKAIASYHQKYPSPTQPAAKTTKVDPKYDKPLDRLIKAANKTYNDKLVKPAADVVVNAGKAIVRDQVGVGKSIGKTAADHAISDGKVVERAADPYEHSTKVLAKHGKKKAKSFHDWFMSL